MSASDRGDAPRRADPLDRGERAVLAMIAERLRDDDPELESTMRTVSGTSAGTGSAAGSFRGRVRQIVLFALMVVAIGVATLGIAVIGGSGGLSLWVTAVLGVVVVVVLREQSRPGRL